ncbi:MAG TPA: hypothetical protein VNW68_03395 [Candidatus Limnocylindria bacterium]|nr:hypothetical protein [Candidatus Limnocylindria bacterium]
MSDPRDDEETREHSVPPIQPEARPADPVWPAPASSWNTGPTPAPLPPDIDELRQVYWREPAPPATSAIVVAAAIVLFLLGSIAAAAGVVGLVFGAVADDLLARYAAELPDVDIGRLRAILAGPARGVMVVGFASILVIGLLHLVATIGLLLHRTWARVLGLVVGLFGVLLGAGGLALPIGREPFIASAVVLGCYAFVVIALIVGGSHFARRYAP